MSSGKGGGNFDPNRRSCRAGAPTPRARRTSGRRPVARRPRTTRPPRGLLAVREPLYGPAESCARPRRRRAPRAALPRLDLGLPICIAAARRARSAAPCKPCKGSPRWSANGCRRQSREKWPWRQKHRQRSAPPCCRGWRPGGRRLLRRRPGATCSALRAAPRSRARSAGGAACARPSSARRVA